MALTVKTKIEDHSSEVLKELDEKISVALEAVGLQAERNAKRLCPVDTGRLRNSITYATSKQHDGGQPPAQQGDWELRGLPSDKVVYIGTNVEYAPFVELGSSRQRPQPYLRPAVQNYKDQYRKIIERYLKGGA